jgi:two-component system NarL family sensor kinase
MRCYAFSQPKLFINPDDKNIILLVIIGISAMLLLILSFLLVFLIGQRKKTQYQMAMQQLKEEQQNMLIEAAVKSEENERHRIAEELHDEVGALLAATKLHISALDTNSMTDEDAGIHERSKELLDDSIQRVRNISHNLHSIILKELGLYEGLKSFIRKLTSDSVLQATMDFDEGYESKNTDRDISVYRVLQELLNNIIKYASATQLNVKCISSNEKLTIILTHNGDGLSQQQFETLRYKPNGLGLKNIQNRIILLKGIIFFERKEGSSSVTISIPQKMSN